MSTQSVQARGVATSTQAQSLPASPRHWMTKWAASDIEQKGHISPALSYQLKDQLVAQLKAEPAKVRDLFNDASQNAGQYGAELQAAGYPQPAEAFAWILRTARAEVKAAMTPAPAAQATMQRGTGFAVAAQPAASPTPQAQAQPSSTQPQNTNVAPQARPQAPSLEKQLTDAVGGLFSAFGFGSTKPKPVATQTPAAAPTGVAPQQAPTTSAASKSPAADLDRQINAGVDQLLGAVGLGGPKTNDAGQMTSSGVAGQLASAYIGAQLAPLRFLLGAVQSAQSGQTKAPAPAPTQAAPVSNQTSESKVAPKAE